MEEPPALPPKDAMYTSDIGLESPLRSPASGSKRKRLVEDYHGYGSADSNIEVEGHETRSPKRSRPHTRESEASASEDNAPTQPRLVRRKKGSRNLSTLSLRHAARTQTASQGTVRDSRFHEGSLTDKPSGKPPSIFTRRKVSNNPSHVDTLMSDYHDSVPTPRGSIERGNSVELQQIELPKKTENGGLFQFGRQLAANFHPVSLWKSLWNDSKDELAREQIEEEERQAKIKLEAEAKYAEMKRLGQFGLQAVSNAHISEDDASTSRDSGIAFDSVRPSLAHSRAQSAASQRPLQNEEMAEQLAGEVPESTSKLAKGLKGRLHLKKPSLTNMKSDLRRMKSDFSLTGNRESSSSMSPVKMDFGSSTLKQSASKADLKKTQKLSKRVSDLESKLQQARMELNDALVEASPVPKLGGKYERFTPYATIKRPKFMPGKLPSLPSERILMAGLDGSGENESEAKEPVTVNEPRRALDLSLNDFLAEREEDGEDTIKASRARKYPTRASSLFNLKDDNTENQPPTNDKVQSQKPLQHKRQPSESTENMDPNSFINVTGEAAPEPAKPVDYASLDAKLKALDENVKTARNAAKPKKRKSAAEKDDKTFKPGKTVSDDDGEWEEATPRKKRKSGGGKNESSPPHKRSTRAADKSSPNGKKGKSENAKAKDISSSPAAKKNGKPSESVQHSDEEIEHSQNEYSADELADEQDALRMSMDSQVAPLDPVYEEEEETSLVPLNDEPSKPTAKATPARYTIRSRSTSPHKRAGSVVQPGVEEQMLTRAAQAAQNHRHGTRSVSPPPPNGYTKTTTVVEETVTVVPGRDGVPVLPRGANGSFESLDEFAVGGAEVEVLRRGGKKGDDFEWPADVF